MSRMRLNPADLTVDTFDTAARQPFAAPNVGIDAAEVGTTATIFTNPQTNEQICFCMTWVAEDCIGPTAGCSTGDGGAV
jgi:hypothetical protein